MNSRRRFIGMAGAVAASGLSVPMLARGQSRRKTLKIMQWNHFVPGFDEWFNKSFVVEWGERNDTDVIVTNVGMTSIETRAASEISRRKGHDICMFLSPPASYEDHVVDHRDIYVECERRYGKPLDIAIRSTFNPVTKKYFGFSDAYVPDPVNYRKDLWDDVGIVPATWDDIRNGGRRIKEKHGIPVGFGLAKELDTSMAVRSLLAAFGAYEQNADGRPSLKSRATVDALKYMKALYSETMTDEVFSWDASSNNRQMLAGRGSLTLNAISITRTGESQKIPIAEKIFLGKPARGPVGSVGVMHLMNAYVIWKFAENIEGAKKFLVDLAGQTPKAFAASEFYNFPTYPQLVPDLEKQVAHDTRAVPANKYKVLADAGSWTVGVGYPGYANAAIDEIFREWLMPRMFADVASGKLSAEAAVDMYSAQVVTIYDKWRKLKKV